MSRAGFQPKQIADASYCNMTGAIWDSIDSKTRFFMLCKLTNSPAEATRLLGEASKSKDLLNMNKEVKINRLPGVLCICRKDELAKRHHSLRERFGELEFDFVPETFSVPSERGKAIERMLGGQIPEIPDIRETRGSKQQNLWIVKPCIRSGGQGIQLIDNIFDMPCVDENIKDVDQAIVQKYIHNPFLINGHKFDMRFYVLITSVDPLMIYLYKDGLARFATEPYNTDCMGIKNNCIHLTNSKVNKDNTESYGDHNEDPFSGFLWTLSMLQEYLQNQGVDWDDVSQDVEEVVIKTIILGYDKMKQDCQGLNSSYNCYKLLGFDIMLDENLKPWVLEVNTDPWLFADPVDVNLKSSMVAEMFNIVGFHIPSEIASRKDPELRRMFPNYAKFSQDPRMYNKVGNNQMAIDLRLLMKSEEEIAQTKGFLRVFPTVHTSRYQRFLGEAIHSDQLLQAWETLKEVKQDAIEILVDCCHQNLHLTP